MDMKKLGVVTDKELVGMYQTLLNSFSPSQRRLLRQIQGNGWDIGLVVNLS